MPGTGRHGRREDVSPCYACRPRRSATPDTVPTIFVFAPPSQPTRIWITNGEASCGADVLISRGGSAPSLACTGRAQTRVRSIRRSRYGHGVRSEAARIMTTRDLGGVPDTETRDQALNTVTTSADGDKPLDSFKETLQDDQEHGQEGGRETGRQPARGGWLSRWRRRWWDVAAAASYVLLAFWVTARVWRHLDHGLADNRMDQAFFEWMLAHGAHVVTNFAYPFVSPKMNVPDGVNM